jgi:acetyl esterase/lipase
VNVIRYGAHPSQHGTLTLPGTPGPWPVVVILHGGFWRTAYGAELGEPLAEQLVQHGVAAWNLEYRRVGNDAVAGGGGWPTTCLDVAEGVDALAGPGQLAASGRLDLSRVFALGHSAGGHLAGWLAGRAVRGPAAPGGAPVVPITGFVSQAGVLDLALAMADNLGAGAAQAFLGQHGDDASEVALASPVAYLPTAVPSVCVHGTADDVVPINQSESYVTSASAAGDRSRLVAVAGADHSAPIDVSSAAWAACLTAALELASVIGVPPHG